MTRSTRTTATLALGVAAAAGILTVLLAPPIARALEPLALRFDGDGAFDDENRAALLRMIRVAGGTLVLAAAGAGIWLAAWFAAATRLGSAAPRLAPRLPAVTPLDLATVIGAMAALAGLSALHLGRGLEFDEIATIREFVTASWSAVFTKVVVFNNHVPFSALSRLSHLAFGSSEVAFRLPALVLGLASLPVLWSMVRHWLGAPVAAAAVWLLAVAPLMVQYSTSARGYTGLLFFGTLSWRLFLAGLEQPSAWRLAASAAALAVATWFNLYGVFIGAGQALTLAWLFWQRPDALTTRAFRGTLLALAGAGALAVLLYLPVALRMLLEIARRGRGTFQPDFPVATVVELAGGSAVVAVLVLAGFWFVGRSGSRGALLPLLTAGTAIGSTWILHPLDLYPRFFMFLLPLVVAAVAMTVVGPQITGRLRAVGWLVVLAIVGGWAWRSTTAVPEEGYRAAARAIMAAGPDQTVVGVGIGSGLIDYYLGYKVPVADTLADFEKLTRTARQVVVVHRRGMHEERVHPVKRLLDEQGRTSTAYFNLSVYVWAP